MREKKEPERRTVTALLLVAAVALIVAGIATHQAGDVFQKAVNVCLECIGVG